MTGAGTQLDSLRLSSREAKRLAWLFALSLLAHLVAWGGYEGGKAINLWARLHLPPVMLFGLLEYGQEPHWIPVSERLCMPSLGGAAGWLLNGPSGLRPSTRPRLPESGFRGSRSRPANHP